MHTKCTQEYAIGAISDAISAPHTGCTQMAKPQQLPSGKWRVQIRKNGVYRSKTFISRKAAAEWEGEMCRQVEQIKAGGYTQPKGLTLSHLIDLYLQSPVGKQAKSTKLFTLEQLRQRMGVC